MPRSIGLLALVVVPPVACLAWDRKCHASANSAMMSTNVDHATHNGAKQSESDDPDAK